MEKHTQHHADVSAKDIENGKVMAIIAYIIALIPYFAEKDNKFVRFHAIQGMNILIVCVAWSIVSNILLLIFGMISIGLAGIFFIIFNLVNLALAVLDILWLVYAAQGQMKKVPFIDKIQIIKK